ncbi:GGDEF domain-containing protein [Solibacillus daqui]|uniref:GGDEF domain-containing protein n=1 Tax=Solibacillus daqui TaxID=2912187 RepID=UPI0023672CF9|nr:GGDEF domain-containing protein [Solibacillus daqui]
MFSNENKIRSNAVVFLVVTIMLALLFDKVPTHQMDIYTFLGLLLVTIFAACYPLKYGQMERINIFWIMIPVLYLYGLPLMILYYQLAIFAFLLISRMKLGNFSHYPIYAMVFFVGPLLSYTIITIFGFEFDTMPFLQMLLVNCLFYAIFALFSGVVIMTLNKQVKGLNLVKYKESLFGEVLSSIFFVLLGTALYTNFLMYGKYAVVGALLVYIITVKIYRNYDATLQKSATLENVMEFQVNFNDYETQQQITKEFLQKVILVTGAKQVSVVYETEEHFIFNNAQPEKRYIDRFQLNLLQKVFAENKIHYIKKRAYLQMEHWLETDIKTESLLVIPIDQFDHPAMLVLESDALFAFNKVQVEHCKLLVTAYKTALEHKSVIEETIYKSERCALTNLYNYRYLTERIEEMELQLVQHKMDNISAIILDIDHFKRLNDTYGHENGNSILKEFAAHLQALVDEQYVLARYGGEEFVILLPNTTSDEALKLAEHYRQVIETLSFQITVLERQLKKEMAVHVTVSIGVASIPEHTNKLSDLITFADKALYVGAKQAGRNRVAIFK